jgi:hypothetical protein
MDEQSGHQGQKGVTIHIDRKMVKVTADSLTGAELRQLPDSPIGADYDLYLEVPGGEDRLIADDETVALTNGMHFFSVQRHITPGG